MMQLPDSTEDRLWRYIEAHKGFDAIETSPAFAPDTEELNELYGLADALQETLYETPRAAAGQSVAAARLLQEINATPTATPLLDASILAPSGLAPSSAGWRRRFTRQTLLVAALITLIVGAMASIGVFSYRQGMARACHGFIPVPPMSAQSQYSMPIDPTKQKLKKPDNR